MVRKIFLIDDSDDDEFFVRRTVAKLGITSKIVRFEGGREAIAYFSRAGADPAQDRCSDCDVVFLDIKMPCVGGFDVLHWLRANRPVAPPPLIVMMSSSDFPDDIERAKALGADSYVVKPLRPGDFTRLATELSVDWDSPQLHSPVNHPLAKA